MCCYNRSHLSTHWQPFKSRCVLSHLLLHIGLRVDNMHPWHVYDLPLNVTLTTLTFLIHYNIPLL